MANKLYYKVQRTQSEGGYEHLHIDLMVADNKDYIPRQVTLSFSWQNHYDRDNGGWREWYGFLIRPADCSNLETLGTVTKLARQILKDPDRPWRTWSPAEILERLEELKAVCVVYDCRVSNFIPLNEVASAELRCWLDDYRELGNPSCTVSVLAEKMETAQTLIMQELFTQGYEDVLAQYIQAGKPVMMRSDRAPEVVSPAALLELS